MVSTKFQITQYLPNEKFYLQQGIHQAQSDQPTKAILSFKKSIFLKPEWLEPYGHLAWAYLNKRFLKEAEKIYLWLIRLKPDKPEILYILSHLYTLKNQPEKSKEYLSQALKTDSQIQTKIHFPKVILAPFIRQLLDKSNISFRIILFTLYRNSMSLWFIEKLLVFYRTICFYPDYLFVFLYDYFRDNLTTFYKVTWMHSQQALKFPLRYILLFFHRYRIPFYYGGIYYPRNTETPLAMTWLAAESGQKILEIGTGLSVLTSALVKKGCLLYCTDADSYILQLKNFLEQTDLKKYLDNGNLKVEIADGRNLPYPDDSFDRVLSISTIEHFPEDGDIQSAKEIARVLKSGGIAVITTEVESKYREFWTEMPFYTGFQYPSHLDTQDKKIKGFYRFYTEKEIRERIVNPSELRLLRLGFISDRFPFRRHFEPTSPLWKRFLLTHFSSIFAVISLRTITENDLKDNLSGTVGYIILQKS